MKLSIIAILLATVFIVVGFTENQSITIIDEAEASTMIDTSKTMDEAIAMMEALVKGKEDMPAEEVFENIQILKGFPAGRVIPVMKMAFNNSLGVDCKHCHNINDWSSDEMNEKLVTRQMWKMVGEINNNLLSSIEHLEGPDAVINCTTCHRGEVKPALRMPMGNQK